MDAWKNIKIDGVAKITKCVAEFEVWQLDKIPWAKFKVKIIEEPNGAFFGFTNLRLKSKIDGSPEGGVGVGRTIEQALEDTILYFMEELNQREELTEQDFEWADPEDF